MAGKFRANSRVYEVALDGGHVMINGNPIVDKPIVFEHSSGSLAIKLGCMYTFSPIRSDISLEGSVIEWHGTSGRHDTWTRSEVLGIESVESARKCATDAAKQQLELEGQQLKIIYLTCKSFERHLKDLILEAPGNLSAAVLARRMECAVCCVT